jgi:hypothetical protein
MLFVLSLPDSLTEFWGDALITSLTRPDCAMWDSLLLQCRVTNQNSGTVRELANRHLPA